MSRIKFLLFVVITSISSPAWADGTVLPDINLGPNFVPPRNSTFSISGHCKGGTLSASFSWSQPDSVKANITQLFINGKATKETERSIKNLREMLLSYDVIESAWIRCKDDGAQIRISVGNIGKFETSTIADFIMME